ncbi:MAG: glycosyltransferase family 10, partial [Cytophagales bacterium]|nr:glycosyltransferase family 10 [Cytophagales bacterium]
MEYISTYDLFAFSRKLTWELDYEYPDWVIFGPFRGFESIYDRYGRPGGVGTKLFISGENLYRKVGPEGHGESAVLALLWMIVLRAKFFAPFFIFLQRWLVRHYHLFPHGFWYKPQRRKKSFTSRVTSYVEHIPDNTWMVLTNANIFQHPRVFSMPYVIPTKHQMDLERPGLWQNLSSLSSEAALSRKFCCMIINNCTSLPRLICFERLSSYKRVDCMGRSHLTNVSKIRLPRRLMDLTDIYRQYKFVITMENTEAEDYITEKLLLGLAA